MANLEQQFEAASADSKKLKNRPDDETILELYSYFKQATDGDATGTRPGPFDFVARAKYDAWKTRTGMSKDMAMKAYVKLVNHLKAQD